MFKEKKTLRSSLFTLISKPRADKRTAKRKTGDIGEELAVKYLKENYYIICERNKRIGKNEIDIIAKRNGYYIFIEVKTTASDSAEAFKYPSEAVTREKQRNMIEAARQYMGGVWEYEKKIAQTVLTPAAYSNIRFDIIEVYLNRETPEINHIENAFYAEKGNKRKWKT